MKLKISSFILAAVVTLSQADDVKLGKAYIVGGICQKNEVVVTQTAEGLTLDIESFGLALRQGSSSGATRVTCNVRIPITLPAGFRVRRIEGRVEGSLAKSRNADVSLTIMAGLGTVSAVETFSFPMGMLYGSADYQERFSIFPRLDFHNSTCKRQDIIGLDAKWIGSRSSRNDFAISTGNSDDERDGLRGHYRIVLAPC